MNRLSRFFPVVSILTCGLLQPPSLAAFGIGLSMSCLGFWMGRKWPDPKPMFVPIHFRPAAKILQEERHSTALFASAMIVGGLICLLFLPQMQPVTIWTDIWPPMGAHAIGLGIGSLIFGWIAAPKAVAEHNAWLAKMGSDPHHN